MFALVGDMKLLFVLFVLMLPFDAEFKASVDDERDVVRFVVAVLDADDVLAVVVAVVVVVVVVVVVGLTFDETEDENEPLFAPVFTN